MTVFVPEDFVGNKNLLKYSIPTKSSMIGNKKLFCFYLLNEHLFWILVRIAVPR